CSPPPATGTAGTYRRRELKIKFYFWVRPARPEPATIDDHRFGVEEDPGEPARGPAAVVPDVIGASLDDHVARADGDTLAAVELHVALSLQADAVVEALGAVHRRSDARPEHADPQDRSRPGPEHRCVDAGAL